MCAPMRLTDFSYDLLQMYVCRAAFPVVAGAVGSACVQIRMGTTDLTHTRPFPRMRQGFQATVSACGLRACIAELKSFLFGMSPCNLVSPLTLALRTLLRGPPQPGMKFADWQGGGSERGGMPGRLKSGTTLAPPLGHSQLLLCSVVLCKTGLEAPGP
jgi:hypothetical protein